MAKATQETIDRLNRLHEEQHELKMKVRREIFSGNSPQDTDRIDSLESEIRQILTDHST